MMIVGVLLGLAWAWLYFFRRNKSPRNGMTGSSGQVGRQSPAVQYFASDFYRGVWIPEITWIHESIIAIIIISLKILMSLRLLISLLWKPRLMTLKVRKCMVKILTHNFEIRYLCERTPRINSFKYFFYLEMIQNVFCEFPCDNSIINPGYHGSGTRSLNAGSV